MTPYGLVSFILTRRSSDLESGAQSVLGHTNQYLRACYSDRSELVDPFSLVVSIYKRVICLYALLSVVPLGSSGFRRSEARAIGKNNMRRMR